jgi:hypothetical protein
MHSSIVSMVPSGDYLLSNTASALSCIEKAAGNGMACCQHMHIWFRSSPPSYSFSASLPHDCAAMDTCIS